MTDNTTYTAIGLIIFIGAFFLLRFVFLWYWKVDTIVKNQEETNRLLSRILAKAEETKDGQ